MMALVLQQFAWVRGVKLRLEILSQQKATTWWCWFWISSRRQIGSPTEITESLWLHWISHWFEMFLPTRVEVVPCEWFFCSGHHWPSKFTPFYTKCIEHVVINPLNCISYLLLTGASGRFSIRMVQSVVHAMLLKRDHVPLIQLPLMFVNNALIATTRCLHF